MIYCKSISAMVRCNVLDNNSYDQGLDIVEADAWIRKHRSHRGVSKEMDTQLEALYFPNGRVESDARTNDVSRELEIDEEAMTPDEDVVVDDDLDAREDQSGIAAAASSALETAAAGEYWPQESIDEQDNEDYLLFRYIEEL
jgi:hypothetical protein